TVSQNGMDRDIDARPSDAMALAIRFNAPFFATEGVLRHTATHGPDGIFSYGRIAKILPFNEIREPVVDVHSPARIEDHLAPGTDEVTWAVGGPATFEAETIEGVGGRPGKSAQLAFDFRRYMWPIVSVRLLPSERWAGRRLVVDLFVPDDVRL